MNLLCPNCGKMLTVPEQYAGQLMKCPLCSGTFTVPALPPGGALDAPAPPSAPPAPAFQQSAPSDPYHPQQSSSPQPAFDAGGRGGAGEPAFPTSPPPPPQQAVSQTGGPGLPSESVTPGEYTGGWQLRTNLKILQWVPAVALLLVFFIQFFPW